MRQMEGAGKWMKGPWTLIVRVKTMVGDSRGTERRKQRGYIHDRREVREKEESEV